MAEKTLEQQLAEARAIADSRDAEIKRARRAEGKAMAEVERLEKRLQMANSIRKADLNTPAWLAPKVSRRSAAHRAMPVLMLSDLHLDEVVDPREMDNMNAYDREIAQQRLERVVNGTVDQLTRYFTGVSYDGLIVALLGDILTGDIHEELAKTNEDAVPGSIVHWVPLIASALTHLQAELDVPVYVPCVDGNHDRSGKRIQYKRRAEESFAWIIYNWLADHLRDNPNIRFEISESSELLFPVYDTNFLTVHGDAAKGGGGIAGLWPPLSRYVLKKQASYGSVGRPFDYALMGHWHQWTIGENFIVNGSLKGYDEYARGNGFKFQKPEQALFLVTPERGITQHTTIHGE